ncbi:hypothetical protein [Umezawaea tangerina]|uniref:Helix-turn-helix protein n=1 Tax=Umezawaea tangerina TaxID=84725 RepID=A0A2T0SPD4_9PSEU|nr:hypothetical protein [Umezawaea tangerina]PRY35282.1 hypothetical protein CLV43_114200 [Umezawaea tangerina]
MTRTDGRRWGKAGERLSEREVRQRVGRIVRRREIDVETRRVDDERAREKWAMGLVIPAHITIALDALGLHGSEVDAACGVREPAVDDWEAGRLYPTWEQILALAALTAKRPMYFMAPVHPVTSAYETSLRFHRKHGELIPLPVHRFTTGAMQAARRIGVTS